MPELFLSTHSTVSFSISSMSAPYLAKAQGWEQHTVDANGNLHDAADMD